MLVQAAAVTAAVGLVLLSRLPGPGPQDREVGPQDARTAQDADPPGVPRRDRRPIGATQPLADVAAQDARIAAHEGSPAGSFDLAGVVRSADGTAIAGARVAIHAVDDGPAGRDRIARTSQAVVESLFDGGFACRGISISTVGIRVEAPGHVTGWFQGPVPTDGSPIELRVRRGEQVHVRVQDVDGLPLRGVTVGLYPQPRKVFLGSYPTHLVRDRSAITADDGTCVLGGMDARTYQVAARAKGLGFDCAFVVCGRSEVVLALDPKGSGSHRYTYEGLSPDPFESLPDMADPAPSPARKARAADGRTLVRSPKDDTPGPPEPDDAIGGRVLDPLGIPLFGVRVTARPAGERRDEKRIATAGTDCHGRFALTGLPDGSYEVTAMASAYRWAAVGEVHVPHGPALEIRLTPRPTIRGRIVGQSGAPLSGVLVECEQGDGGWVVTRADGSFALSHELPADEVGLRFTREDLADHSENIVVGTDDVEPREFVLATKTKTE